MSSRINRRGFLHAAAASGAVLGAGDFGFLSRLRPVSAAERVHTNLVRLDPGIEPTVRPVEDTPRERLLEEVAVKVKKGFELSRAARRPAAGGCGTSAAAVVGFKFHAVLVVNSAHLASMASPDSQRWLAIFWARTTSRRRRRRRHGRSGWRMAAGG